ncbi:ergosterol biosynthesis ERG4/ERG24 family protein [Dictyocaulus viviparus]|uniref:7-dehydrocholesterol reductase n=1 Tax=Dictyocaulus viviparus TaxID=29172 RepID=A0A0D8XL59_DICVI|nr:ergosterol biosynthesis ERG4/ERG24 family protein [Dictyocaulus viviparus]
MQQRIMRRTSFGGSTSSSRRSSVSSRDIQAILMASSKQHIPNTVIFCMMIALPLFSFFYLLLIHQHRGNFVAALSAIFKPSSFRNEIEPFLCNVVAWKFTTVFLSLQLIFHSTLPHDTVYLLSLSGDTKKLVNGFSSFLLICLLYVMGGGLGLYRNDLLFIYFPSIITCFAVVCLTAYGIMLINYRLRDTYSVSTVFEFYFGVELHPTVLDIDIKHFIRSRITFVIWPLFIISSLYYQRNTYGKLTRSLIGSSFVQIIYIVKYHWTEYLALNSLDYKHSNCGFYKLWSNMVTKVLFPILYCSSITIIAYTQKSISLLTSLLLTVIAIFFIYMTTVIDKQKYDFRKSKGKIKINGLDPYFITAKYKNDQGDTSANLLLGVFYYELFPQCSPRSGYWSKSRHLNYACEAATFFIFSAFQGSFAPIACHIPALFITGFLLTRFWMDESRCLVTYGQSWIQYCNKVPFRILPGIY